MAANQKEAGEHFDAVDQHVQISTAGRVQHLTTNRVLNDGHAEPVHQWSAQAHINGGKRTLRGLPAHMANSALHAPPPTPLALLPLYDFHMRPVHGWRGTLAQRRGLLDVMHGSCD